MSFWTRHPGCLNRKATLSSPLRTVKKRQDSNADASAEQVGLADSVRLGEATKMGIVAKQDDLQKQIQTCGEHGLRCSP